MNACRTALFALMTAALAGVGASVHGVDSGERVLPFVAIDRALRACQAAPVEAFDHPIRIDPFCALLEEARGLAGEADQGRAARAAIGVALSRVDGGENDWIVDSFLARDVYAALASASSGL